MTIGKLGQKNWPHGIEGLGNELRRSLRYTGFIGCFLLHLGEIPENISRLLISLVERLQVIGVTGVRPFEQVL